jgi:transposase
MKHKTEDYKLSAVKYYLSNNFSLDYVCNIFDCKKQSLARWIERYKDCKNIERHNRTSISYKISKEQLLYAIKLLKNNEQITMIELKKLIMLKYPDFNITSQHLGIVLRDNNITRKRTKHRHFPKTRYGIETNKKKELDDFYNDFCHPLHQILCTKKYLIILERV